MTKGQDLLRQMREMLTIAPNEQLDSQMKLLVYKWSDVPTALQILEVLDTSIYAALASGFTIGVLQSTLEVAMKEENTTLEALIPLATWRNRD